MRSMFAALALGFGLLTGIVATPNTAQALPAAPVSQPTATTDTSVEKVGYYRRHNRHYGYRNHGYRNHGYRNYGYRSYGYSPFISGFSFNVGPRYRNHGYRNHGYRSYGHGYRHW
jgi:hypothetical protein